MDTQIEICGEYYRKNITELYLSYKNLTEIPINIKYLTNLQILNLSGNKLAEIKENTFNTFTNLQTLDLSNNKLTEIKENTFNELVNLKKLYLGSNNLTEIKENTFGQFANLEKLYLGNNTLKEIPANIKYLTNLQTLDLGYNKLTEIKENTFSKLTNLQTLYLGSNKLIELNENIFGRLINLQELYLHKNELIEIKENTFGQLTNLQNLSLGCNQLTEIKENIFYRLTNLQELDLNGNELIEIKENTFDQLTNLNALSLGNNKLTEIKENIFYRLTNLQELDLSYNKLKSLPLSILSCRRLNELTYENNDENITIDIRITRFIERMQNYNNHGLFSDSQNVHSSSIQNSVKESINNLMKDPFTCEKKLIVEFLLTSKLECISSLLSYLDDEDYHSTLLLTFYDVFVKVFGRISNSEHKEELMRRLDEEMMESECKCFTGRITRLLNVLNGFYEDIQITISNNERISAIILSTLDGQEMSDELREICRAKLKDIGIEDEEIEVWLR